MEFKLDRLKNTTSGIVWGFIYKAASVVFPFITRTIVIYKLGITYTGLGSLFNSILSMLSLAELGIGSAIVFSMYKPVYENDTVKIRQYLNFYKKCYKIIGCIVLVIGLLILPILPYLVDKDCPDKVNIYILFSIYLFNSVISYFLFAYKSSILNATQRVDTINRIALISAFVVFIGQVLALIITANFYVYIIWLPIGTIFNNFLTHLVSKKMYPDIYANGNISNEEKKEIFSKIKGLIYGQIGSIILTSSDTLVISYYLGLKECGIYNNYYYIITAVFNLFAIVYTTLQPVIGNSLLTDTYEERYQRFNFLYFMSMCMNTFCFSCLFNLFQPFMRLWVGENMMYEFPMVFLLCVYFYFSKIGDIASVYKHSAGLWDKMQYTSIVAAIVNLMLNLILTKLIGIYGIVLSTLAAYLFVYLPFYSLPTFEYCFKKKEAFGKYNVRIIINLVIAIIISVLVSLILNWIPGNSWIEFSIRTCLVAMLTLILITLIYYPTGKIKEMFIFIRKILLRRC